ncbi:MAG TPA: iron ABC transporter permease [Candidatus Hydrogenedentes bacterium]|nr:iron ABC transporter permease [Candidatus Hydrogenedentota bacterium]
MTVSSRSKWILPVLAVCLLIILASILFGAQSLNMAQAWHEWRTHTPLSEAPTLSILLNQRLPRTLAALLAGAGLALAGCAFQALLRNPLAEPYTLGVASAGALGTWLSFILVDVGWFFGLSLRLPTAQICAFAFAGAEVLLVYGLASRKRRMAPSVLLLAGVTMGMLGNSGIMFTRYLAAPERLVMMDRWLMGGVDVLGYRPVITLFIGVVPCAAILIAQAAKFDQFGFNAELAAGRGIHLGRLQVTTFFVGSLMTAIIVSVVGPIGFVGLVIPHSVRMITGSRHRLLMPLSLIVGGAFLCACDIAARKILPGETPIGIITTLIGGPFFLYLLIRRKFTDWDV